MAVTTIGTITRLRLMRNCTEANEMSSACPTPWVPPSFNAGLDPGIPFSQIAAPGCYVCNWNGFLLRVSAESLGADCTRTLNIIGSNPLFVTKISDDPRLPVGQARRIAAQRGLKIAF